MTTSTNNILKDTVFKKLVQALSPTDSTLENVFLEAEWGKHRLSCYALPEDNYTLMVEDFGFESKGVWYQANPTDNQLKTLEDLLEKELDRLYKSTEQTLDYERDIDDMEQEMQHTYNHINNNFYTGY
ncbi:hypothetical protein [Neptunitalea lumnitzerae]|uniref:Uncharacterized protein n=1 Tax=Neptunitalea lumnitzerae TaxID=2965509 RepID=A0ABQ5MEK0_9FLAO|nr:hypothetical protein [Neptunitalea sp. Y10]GLB47822.1 hypothetical protein Y10_01900 [Neptunitalea sp. Y10]